MSSRITIVIIPELFTVTAVSSLVLLISHLANNIADLNIMYDPRKPLVRTRPTNPETVQFVPNSRFAQSLSRPAPHDIHSSELLCPFDVTGLQGPYSAVSRVDETLVGAHTELGTGFLSMIVFGSSLELCCRRANLPARLSAGLQA
ncbi:hypothetical protein F4804DRAFT_152517 [Jackrogersella minutella]|nr:hypothetical protein F4804DRAFT_152517 [Jackrogersella minutella]